MTDGTSHQASLFFQLACRWKSQQRSDKQRATNWQVPLDSLPMSFGTLFDQRNLLMTAYDNTLGLQEHARLS